MEIKILCACGTKFAFEVEPEDGKMPTTVGCPSCGADATAKANEIIQKNATPAVVIPKLAPVARVTSTPAAAAPAATAVRLPSQVSAPAAAPAPKLSLSKPHAAPPSMPAVPAAGSAPAAPAATPAPARPAARPVAKSASSGGWLAKIMGMARMGFTVLCVGFVVLAVGAKWLRRAKLVSSISKAAGQASVDAKNGEVVEDIKSNLVNNGDVVQLLVKHSEESEVSEAFVDFAKAQWKRDMKITQGTERKQGQHFIQTAHNGVVSIVSDLDWSNKEYIALAQHFSTKFNTVVAAVAHDEDGEFFVFDVYEQGKKSFHADRQLKGTTLADAKDVVKMENQTWAASHGYKPGSDGVQGFTIENVDEITKHLGIKLWDRKGELSGLLVQ